MNKQVWIRDISRDIIALGSIVFYSLVLIRALVGPFWIFFTYLASAAIFLFVLFLLHKNFETYLARGIILASGTSYFYQDFIFALFALFIYILMVISSNYIGNPKSRIIKGILFGMLAVGLGYFMTQLFFEKPWH